MAQMVEPEKPRGSSWGRPPSSLTSIFENCHPEDSKHPGGGRIESPSKSTTLLMWRLLRRTHFSRIDFLPLLRKGRKWILEELSLLLIYPRIWEGEGYRRSEILNPTNCYSYQWSPLLLNGSRRFSSGFRSELKCDVELDRRPGNQQQNKEPWDLVRTYKKNKNYTNGK